MVLYYDACRPRRLPFPARFAACPAGFAVQPSRKAMPNTFGKLFTISTWGESHGAAVGVVIDGCPARLPLAEGDIQAFERVMSARRAARSEEIRAAYRAAVEPPLRMCELSLRVLELAVEVAERGHPHAAADAGAAALFAAAALESAALSVQLYLRPIDDEEFCAARVGEATRTRARACALRDSARAAVHEKLETPRARTRVVHG